MNRRLIRKIDEETTKIEDEVEQTKTKAKEFVNKNGRKLSSIGLGLFTLVMGLLFLRGLVSLNSWYDTHRLVGHKVIEINVSFHAPFSIEKRKEKIVVKKVMVTPTPEIFKRDGDIVE